MMVNGDRNANYHACRVTDGSITALGLFERQGDVFKIVGCIFKVEDTYEARVVVNGTEVVAPEQRTQRDAIRYGVLLRGGHPEDVYLDLERVMEIKPKDGT